MLRVMLKVKMMEGVHHHTMNEEEEAVETSTEVRGTEMRRAQLMIDKRRPQTTNLKRMTMWKRMMMMMMRN